MPEENGETIIAYRPAWAGGVAVAVRWPWISRLIRHLPCLSRQSSCARSRRDCSFPRRVASQSRRLIEVHNDLGEEGGSSAASLSASFLLQAQPSERGSSPNAERPSPSSPPGSIYLDSRFIIGSPIKPSTGRGQKRERERGNRFRKRKGEKKN